MSDLAERIEDLFQTAVETLKKIQAESEDENLDAAVEYLDELEDVVDETEDILEHVDLTELLAAVDWSELPEAVDLEDVPDAIEEGDLSEAVTLQQLLAIVNLSEVWNSMDAREAWRDKRELEDEVDDLTDDDGDGLFGNDDGDDGWFGDDEEGDDGYDVSMPDTDAHDFDSQTVENAIQSQVSDSVDTFREKLIDAHHRFREIRDENAERFPDRKRNHSRNPTAVPTVPNRQSPSGRGMRHSTVPEETRHSSAPNRKRIYGTRFDRARGDDDE